MIRSVACLLFVVILVGCSSTQSSRTMRTGVGRDSRFTPAPPARPTPQPGPPIVGESAWKGEAAKWIGAPYRTGGTTRAGMDCSGLVCRMYQNVARIDLPRTAEQQSRTGVAIPPGQQLRPGDIVFFQTSNRPVINHSGVYLGDNVFVHASTSRGVIYTRLTETFYAQRYRGARRILR